jgi:hypothetical protein
MRPDLTLHRKVLCQVCIVLRALDLVGVPAVAIVGLGSFVGLEKMAKDLVKTLDVGVRTGRVRTLDPHQVPRQNVNA